MNSAGLRPLQRERNLILGSLLVLAVAAWAILIWQPATTDRPVAGLTMGMEAPVSLGIWIAMTVAMMFPALVNSWPVPR